MVEVVPVDDVVEHATLIKFDVEGAEAPALRGCSRLMKEDRPKDVYKRQFQHNRCGNEGKTAPSARSWAGGDRLPSVDEHWGEKE